jgi:carbonic anhydrase
MRAPGTLVRFLAVAGIVVVVGLAATLVALPAEKPPADCCKVAWDYKDPARWASLSPCYAPCKGGEQSPIDIENPVTRNLPPLEPSYGILHELPVENNGHTVEAKVSSKEPAEKVTLRIDGVDYRLDRFHFHTPSEHQVNGEDEPMELHLVHESQGGRAAVIGVFIQEGDPNPELSKIWAHLPKKPGDKAVVKNFDLRGLLPKSLASYRYAGSLTTPACGQGVQWNVLASSITITDKQIEDFGKIFPGKNGNSRPVQPLNGRVVVTDVQPE